MRRVLILNYWCHLLPITPFLALYLGLQSQEGSLLERRVVAMGTPLRLEVIAADRSAALVATEDALRAVDEVDQRWSSWRDDSELARIHRVAATQAVPLPAPMRADLRRPLHWAQTTGGAFSPTMRPLIAAWDLHGVGRVPSEADLRTAQRLAASGVLLRPDHSLRLRQPNAGFDAGGFGKGVALDAARRRLTQHGVTSAKLDFGGQILQWGSLAGDIDIAHPRDRTRPVARLGLGDGSFATSGNSERGRNVGAHRVGHLLDPRTGHPAPDFGSLSVWCGDAVDADCLSTGLFVLGPDDALRFADAHDGVEVLILQRQSHALHVWVSRGLRDALILLDPDARLQPSITNHNQPPTSTKERSR